MQFNARLKDSKGVLTEWNPINASNWTVAQRMATIRFGDILKSNYKVLILCKAVNLGVVDYSVKYHDEKKWSQIETRSVKDLLSKA